MLTISKSLDGLRQEWLLEIAVQRQQDDHIPVTRADTSHKQSKRKTMHKWLLMAVVLFAVPVWAGDPEDAAGVQEHPEIPRMPGFVVYAGTVSDFNSVTFPTRGYDEDGKPQGVTKEGKYWQVEYDLKANLKEVSYLELRRNYENAFKKRGGKMVWEGSASRRYEAVYTQPLGKSERWVHLSQANEEDGYYTLMIIDVAEMEQKVELSANEMAEAIQKNGFVVLRGILFDTGKDTLKPESEPLLAEIVSLLDSNKALRLSSEGHTDNVGDKKANLALSKKRAESVKKFLVAQGVDAKRLKTDGKGDRVPVSDNRSGPSRHPGTTSSRTRRASGRGWPGSCAVHSEAR